MKNMFNLFKKQEESKSVEIVTGQPKNVYPAEVMQIHHEFEVAASELLNSAKSIIAESETKDIKKVSRLESLGFKQAAQVTELKPLIQKAELSKEQIELLSYYQSNYPLNKFITKDQVKTICHKYNLVCGEVSRFKGFVPEKNLKEIEKFSVKTKDAITAELIVSGNGSFGTNMGFVTKDEITNDCWGISNGGSATFDAFGTVKNHFSKRIQSFFKDSSVRHIRVQGLNNESTLRICAPVKDMDISGLELVEGYKLQKKHVPDPVVLQPVRGGYLILTAWGDEASDELVVNQKFN